MITAKGKAMLGQESTDWNFQIKVCSELKSRELCENCGDGWPGDGVSLDTRSRKKSTECLNVMCHLNIDVQ